MRQKVVLYILMLAAHYSFTLCSIYSGLREVYIYLQHIILASCLKNNNKTIIISNVFAKLLPFAFYSKQQQQKTKETHFLK